MESKYERKYRKPIKVRKISFNLWKMTFSTITKPKLHVHILNRFWTISVQGYWLNRVFPLSKDTINPSRCSFHWRGFEFCCVTRINSYVLSLPSCGKCYFWTLKQLVFLHLQRVKVVLARSQGKKGSAKREPRRAAPAVTRWTGRPSPWACR